jgi:hypothetical protein
MKKALTFLFFIGLCVASVQAQLNATTTTQGSNSNYVDCIEADIYEPNNSILKASPISSNTVHFAYICDENDVDWYVVTIPQNTSSFKVMLSDCPRDYDMEITDIHSKLLASSYNRGETNEVITMLNPEAGDYFIKVYGFKNDFDTDYTYALRYYLKSAVKAPNNMNSTWRTGSAANEKHELNIYPNPAIDNIQLKYTASAEGVLTINIYDHVGRIMNKISELHGEGINTHQLDISYLPNGFYMVEVIINNERQLKKLTVNKR